MKPTILAPALLVLAACSVGPDFHPPAPPSVERYTAAPLPASTPKSEGIAQSLRDGAIPPDWWTLLGNSELDRWEHQALAANPDLAAALAALKAAEADAAAQRAAFFPVLAASLDASRQQNSGALSPALAEPRPVYNLYTPEVTVSYMPDLFGGTRRAVESASALAEAQRFALEGARLSLVGNLANAAISLASLSDQLAAQNIIVADAERLEAMVSDQLAHGAASQSDLEAQQVLTEQAHVQRAQLQKQLAQAKDQLAVLTGALPAQFQPPALSLADFTLPHQLPLSLPASLLRQRPDLRLAEENLRSANAQVGVAIAQMLPSLTLSANMGSTATTIGDLFTPGSGFWTAAMGLAQPLFDGGALSYRKKAADARLEQAEAQYRSAIGLAFQNTADCLEALHADAAALDHADAAAAHAQSVFARLQAAVAQGQVSRLAVLQAEQANAQAQIALIQVRASRYADTVALFVALGGGWWNSPVNIGETIDEQH